MEIHKLDFKIKDPDYPLATVFLDDQEEQQTLEAFALEKSIEKDGLYPILNCTCGEWGCGGYWVEVKNEADKIIWSKIRIYGDDRDFPRLHVKTPIVFNKDQYQNLITSLLAEKSKYSWFEKSYLEEKNHFEKTGEFYWTGFSAPD